MSLLFASLCYFLITQLLFFNILFMFVSCFVYCFLYCVFRVFILFCLFFLLWHIAVSFLFLYKFTNYCHQVETPLQSLSIIPYHIIYHFISYIISYHITSYHIISYYIIYHIIYYIIPYHIMYFSYVCTENTAFFTVSLRTL